MYPKLSGPNHRSVDLVGRSAAIFALSLGALVASCVDDPPQPCTNDGECLPTFICVGPNDVDPPKTGEDGFCVKGERTITITTEICPAEGGKLTLPAGEGKAIVVTIPPNAVSECVVLTLARASDTLVPTGVTRYSRVWALRPPAATFAVDITVSIPVESAYPTPDVIPQVWFNDDALGQWTPLPGGSSNTTAVGTTKNFGLFVAGKEKEKHDGGPPIDTGFHPDAQYVEPDGGPRYPDAVPRADGGDAQPDLGPIDGGVVIDDSGVQRADTGPTIGDAQALDAQPDGGGQPGDVGEGDPDQGQGIFEDTGLASDVGDNVDLGLGDEADTGEADSGQGGLPDLGIGVDAGQGNDPDGGNDPDLGNGGLDGEPELDLGSNVEPDSGNPGGGDAVSLPDLGTGQEDLDSGVDDDDGGGGGSDGSADGALFPDTGGGTEEDSGGQTGGQDFGGMGVPDSGGAGSLDAFEPDGGMGGGGGGGPSGDA